MKSFVFSLQSVLRLREYDCDESYRKWKDQLNHLNKLRNELGALEQAREEVFRNRRALRNSVFQPSADSMMAQNINYFGELIMMKHKEIESAVQSSEKLQQEFLKSRMELKVVERIREKQLERHETEMIRQEEIELSDLASSRWYAEHRMV